ncbi:hypothetical protein GCM10010478_38040 [Streptomyces erythrogriseus]|uniref:Uncharacterized protein n=2 Tax=Streptomyces TaxID=1883 RepID=A0ABP6JKU7_9ACTN
MNGWTQGPIRRQGDWMYTEVGWAMSDKWMRGVLRCAIGVMGVAAMLMLCGSLAGTAYADETTSGSKNGPRVGLVNADLGQIDDPAEDVLEHVLLLSDGQVWN